MLARIHVSARRVRLHCLDSAEVSPAPKAYQKSSVKPSLPISTKEAQKTLSSLLTILAADECLWCRRDCLFEDIKYTGMEERKMVQCLGRLGVQLLTVLYSTVSISKSFSIQETESHLQLSLSLSLQSPYVLFRRGIFSSSGESYLLIDP